MSEFLIMFREVLEGVLVVGILYTFIVKTGREHLKKSIINGVIASFIATGIFAVIFQIAYGGLEGRQAALFEGTTMLIAAFLLSTMIIWMGRNKNVAASLEKEASDIIEKDKNVSLGLFALTFFGILMTQSLSYANTLLLTPQESDMQEGSISDSLEVEEADTVEQFVEEVEEDTAPAAEASFTQELKKRFIEGGPGFMGIVLICLILGLAIAIERIIYLNLATTNTQKLTNGVEEAISSGGIDAAKDLCRNT